MKTKRILKLENLTPIEQQAYLYSHSIKNGSLLTNDEIAELMEISVNYLLVLFESIEKKVNSPIYYSD